jgi:hypothetical protein
MYNHYCFLTGQLVKAKVLMQNVDGTFSLTPEFVKDELEVIRIKAHGGILV